MQDPRPGIISHKADGRVPVCRPGSDRVPANRVFEIIGVTVPAAHDRERMLQKDQSPNEGGQIAKILPHEDGMGAETHECQLEKIKIRGKTHAATSREGYLDDLV